MDDIDSITARYIADNTSLQVKNMMSVVDKHFHIWTTELFPVLQQQKKSCYRTVVQILHEAGHDCATEDLIRSYFSAIRRRRGIPAKPYKAPIGVTPTVTLTRPAREFRADPGVRVQATDRPVAQAVSSHPVAVPSVKPVEVTDWRSELIRLEREKSSDPWTGADQWMWNYFEAVARSMGRTLPRDFMSVEKSVGDPIKIDCLDKLLAKRM